MASASKLRDYSLTLLIYVLATALIHGCARKPPEPSADTQFAATFVTEYGETTVEYKINFTTDKIRLEPLPSDSGAIIIRKDLGVIWTLMTSKKFFLELPVRPENKSPLVFMPDKVIDYEKTGEDVLDGRTVVEERLVIQNEGDEKKEMLRWFDTQLGWPVRAEDVNGKWKLSYRDIVPGPQEPGLFEIPPDYRMIAGRKRAAPGQGAH